MMLLRRAYETDLEAIYYLAEHSGIGMTTLPKERELLHSRLLWSCDSFAKNVTSPLNEYYLFVLEDLQSHHLVGVSAIEAAIGYSLPFYSYQLSKQTRICHSLKIRSDYEVLNLVNDNQGRSELCTLFLEASYRGSYNGLLLSRSRFLFMAHHPTRFSTMVIADMRGVLDEKGNSPFWDSLGKHFFHMPFSTADRLTLSTNKQFISDLMPRHPIYVQLLPLKAQQVIGKPNQTALPAMNILLAEGFRYNNYVDIFDGGPTIEADYSQIRTINSNQLMTIKTLGRVKNSDYVLVSNTLLDFRGTIGLVDMNKGVISPELATLLNVQPGDLIRVSAI